jgi:uncharacterized protein YjbJ (UPF0337 family)
MKHLKGENMFTNIEKGKWTQIKGEIRKSWGKLTDDEVEQTKGDVTKLAGLVQQKYGETQENVQAKLKNFMGDVAAATEKVTNKVEQKIDHKK